MEFPRKDNIRLENTLKPLRFQVYDWFVPEADKSHRKILADARKRGEPIDYPDEASLYEIYMFGCTEEGHSVCVKVEDFIPYFYVRIPNIIVQTTKSFKDFANDFYMYLLNHKYKDPRTDRMRNIIPYKIQSHLVSVESIKKKEFYGFTNNEDFWFLKISVKSLGLYNSLRFFLKSPPIEFLKKFKEPFPLYESNLDPFLRFIHVQNIQPCGWVELPGGSYQLIANGCENDTFSRANFTVSVNYRMVKPYNCTKTAPILIVSFDLECTSSHGDFPVSKKDYRKLAQDLYQIARFEAISIKELKEAILESYIHEVICPNGSILHQLYPLQKINTETIGVKLNSILPDIFAIMKKIHTMDDEDEDDEEEEQPKVALSKMKLEYENDLNRILSKALPKLQGDAIIQIGTTVHRYGSDDIIYRHIHTLKSCDRIEGVHVNCYENEGDMLQAWKGLIQQLDPDILTGYNIFGFDMPYLWDRAQELGLTQFGVGFGRFAERNCQLIEQSLTSSALGENVMYYLDLDGIVCIDMYKVMQRDHKLDSYKLDSVAQIFLGDHKNDLTPNEIFAKYLGTSTDRKVIAEYCIQDCALVNRIFHKLKVLENNIGMGNVCSVPLSYLFMRGQGIKIFSLVANECRKNNFVIPVLSNWRENNEKVDEVGYEGAIVLPPKEGMYLDDYIVTLDFASLYPSSMIERNLSHDCYVNDPKYDGLEGIDYKTITYDIYEGTGDEKTKIGEQTCKFVQLPNGEKGIIPRILIMLLKQRKVTRKKMEYETLITANKTYTGLIKEKEDMYIVQDVEDNTSISVAKDIVLERKATYNPFEQAVLDAMQLAYKVTANSLYGQIGSRTSQIYLKDIAACTTATGRERIMHAKEFVEEEFHAEVIYGDSVTSYTPVYVRTAEGIVDICTIEQLADKYGNSAWIPCMEDGKQTKEACELNVIETWTDKGWTPLKCVIRHILAPHKKIVRVLTHTGVVDVTDDHSLLDSNGNPVTSKEVSIGTTLLHHPYPECKQDNQTFTEAEAEVMGFFFGDGSCGYYDCESGKKASWALNNSNEAILNKYLDLCSKAYPQFSWVIMRTKESSGVDKISPRCDHKYGNLVEFIQMYRSIMYDKYSKIIPQEIFDAPLNVKQAFWRGLYDSDGDKDVYGYIRIDQKSMLSASHIALLAFYLGYKVSINTRDDKQDIFRITLTNKSQRKKPNAIKKMYEIPYEGYVYDLTTENHHFAAGVGQMIVHNTDSIFCRFKVVDEHGNKLKGLEGLAKAIEKGQKASIAINRILPAPQTLEYEKTFYPFIIFSKKRYVGNLYEDDAYKKPKQKSMGIALKRRDYAPIVKKIYGGIINILLNETDLEKSVNFLNTELKRLVNNEYPLEDLIISKTLRSNYKNPTSIAHKVLAERMTDRDPGNKPQVNDRIPFVYIQTAPEIEVKLQGDRIEHPDYIRQNQLVPDYQFYMTNQLIKPICQLFALCVEQLPNYSNPPNHWEQVDEELKTSKVYKDSEKKRQNRIQALRQKEVEMLLFEPFLTKKKLRIKKEPGERTKKKILALIQNNQVTKYAPILTVEVTENKESKQFIGKIHMVHNEQTLCEETYTLIKKNSKNTLTEAYQKVMCEMFKKYTPEYKSIWMEYGLRIKIKTIRFKNSLAKTLADYNEVIKKIDEANKNMDVELLQEAHEMQKNILIAEALSQIHCELI
uniref:DNA polymerase n=1 Tax=viral metagenome TaxID=1070528 RepID=A0A6C0CU64_9ZZZZ